ncbi:MAG: hypothetical protein A2W82_08180 [Sulfurimonas sp. RIFCSPLOWO2_12_36_12]|uniref:hypothetical protein n=1 Tax=Sulfurimonas sp. RIFCSPLOWO2_12_36_12 TaxID=1802253 RepID=UPI0008D82416|nr:hypothetical protein [Sulfurimonas sp. RIFCSPLOWO2_12_36_12]OHD99643.1 MAG: hypothetical protein A3J26_07970 [Sulfurimonas sp. RIFCSPLOWO2_02_FULL_36_28]OHE03031.1 MAG: hypothetical protein A2W82_08180 [Sulfurimonas sp. RIFCSPLOWO2_12_36_12]
MMITEQIIILGAFFVLIIIYIFNSKLKYYKSEILIKNKIIYALENVKKKIVAGNIGRKIRDTIIVSLPLLYLQIWKLKKL